MSVGQWAEADRPRHKLNTLGAQALTNAELLSILIGTGSREEDAVRLCARVLADCGNNLNTLGKRSAQELMPDLGTATRIYNYMHPQMMDLQTEEFWAILLNQHYRLIKAVRISFGGYTETAVDVRVIMKECVLNNATILAVCHNHPSGNITPSKPDDELTTSIKKACQIMRVHFADHVIITDGRYYSYREQGRI